ncbi:MAG: sulfatase-like hydrolase/transferase [Acidobacteria bacterium]|nr:sulfatase-like hydrolase/transferase [Acidobacteriota bacterium]
MDGIPVTSPASGPRCQRVRFACVALVGIVLLTSCSRGQTPAPASIARPSVLLVTLDTTRADAIGPEAVGITTPAFNAVAARGKRFRQAYATVPETLPSHVSMMTGLYPAGHSIHENGRTVPPNQPVLAEQLRTAGYRTAAFVSSFILSRRFGLARGFDLYDDDLPAGSEERAASATTDAALALVNRGGTRPLFLWVHYFDPHYPYTPPEPFRTRFAANPYLGEVASMDAQLGRLIQAFERGAPGPVAIVIVGDHGEGLGDHGEQLHGNLVYQSTMHVPLVVMGPGVATGTVDVSVSARRVYHTILDWAGLDATGSLRRPAAEIVLGEAMKPYLEYGWQPQTMAVEGRQKSILAGRMEVYDVVDDPKEARDLASTATQSAQLQVAIRDYPVPSPDAAKPADTLGEDVRRSLASLGYVSATAAPIVRKGAPRPVDMTRMFDLLDKASGLFVNGEYARVIPLLEKILGEDPYNLDGCLRLAVAHSSLGHQARAEEMFRRAAEMAPRSPDVRLYLALHYARSPEWARAEPLLEQIVAATPDRLPALEALAVIRERQGRLGDAIELRQKIYTMRKPSGSELAQLGQLAMGAGQTAVAIEAFEKARAEQGSRFAHDLELGVLYLAARRYEDARGALDRVPASHPEYPMALFKRAQVSVLLNEQDKAARIERARRHADQTTRPLIARERLFQGR